jgi:anterior pharynx defective protein 1
MAYVSGLGFGIISGLFQSVNILADAIGPGTMGMTSGSDVFFITSATFALCIILLHTFWNIIFFNGLNNRNKMQIAYVILSHLIFSLTTFLNSSELYGFSLTLSVANVIVTMVYAFNILGGTAAKLKHCITCHQQ